VNSLEEQAKLDAETDAMILYMDLQQKRQWIRFGAILILVFTAAFSVLYLTAVVSSLIGG